MAIAVAWQAAEKLCFEVSALVALRLVEIKAPRLIGMLMKGGEVVKNGLGSSCSE